MPRIAYITKRFSSKSESTIAIANQIIDEYRAQGFDLTLRQLYYQMVARDYIPNSQKSYKQLGSIVNDARLAGLIDWYSITDRTRNLKGNSHWDSPEAIIKTCARQYKVDRWEGQAYRPEVWIEKDALVGVIDGVCSELDVPYFSCRGYNSQSEMWRAGQRMLVHLSDEQTPFIIHLGDHDPSGMDMTRDIVDRFEMFVKGENEIHFHVTRIALNYDQVIQYNPPPNPAKLSDSRANGYIRSYGGDSWELDALEPAVIANLIRDAVEQLLDGEKWDKTELLEREHQEELALLSENMDKIKIYLRGRGDSSDTG